MAKTKSTTTNLTPQAQPWARDVNHRLSRVEENSNAVAINVEAASKAATNAARTASTARIEQAAAVRVPAAPIIDIENTKAVANWGLAGQPLVDIYVEFDASASAIDDIVVPEDDQPFVVPDPVSIVAFEVIGGAAVEVEVPAPAPNDTGDGAPVEEGESDPAAGSEDPPDGDQAGEPVDNTWPTVSEWVVDEPLVRATGTISPTIIRGVTPDMVKYGVAVRAVTSTGVRGSLSETVFLDISSPEPVPAPSVPILSTSLGTATVHWDGKTVNGDPAPLSVRSAITFVSDTEDGTYVPIGQALIHSGEVVASDLEIGKTYWFKFAFLDNANRLSEFSSAASVTVEGITVDLSELEGELADMRDDLTAAEGKITGALTDIDNLETGVSAVTADIQDIIDSGSNLVLDPGFETARWVGRQSSAQAHTGNYSLLTESTGGIVDILVTDYLKATPGRMYYAEVWVYAESPEWEGQIQLGSSQRRTTGGDTWPSAATVDSTIVPGGQWTKLSGYIETREFVYEVTFRVSIRSTVPQGHKFYWDDILVVDVTEAKTAIDAAQAAQNAANNAMATASGKATITDSTVDPSGSGTAEGDWWRKWSNLGTSGTLVASWRWDGSAWVEEVLDETYLPLVNIGSGTYGSLNGDRLVANSIVGDKIVAGSITSSKLTITDWTNLIDDPNFKTPLGSGAVIPQPFDTPWAVVKIANDDSWKYVTTTGGPGKALMYTTGATAYASAVANAAAPAVKQGDQLNLSVKIQNSTSDTLGFYVFECTESGTITTSTAAIEAEAQSGWTEYSTAYEVQGADTKYLKFAFASALAEDHTAYVPGENAWVISPRVRRMNNADLIVDGAVTADKIAAEAIQAEHVAAGAIGTEELQAGSVTSEVIAAGAVTANEIAAGTITSAEIAAGTIGVDNLVPNIGDDIDISANDTVTIIAGQVDAVDVASQATAGELETMQTYYQFGAEGATITKPGSPFALGLRNDAIEMLENGNVVSYWNSGQMFVNSLVGEEVVLGNHKLEKYSTGTVVRVIN